jgi:hypothetical protein
LRRLYSLFDLAVIAASLLLAAGGLAGVLQGRASGWWVMLFFLCCAMVLALAPWVNAARGGRNMQSLTVDDWGIRRPLASGGEEAVAWADLAEVLILTTDEGPFAEDVFFALRAADGSGVLVGQGLATEHDLLEILQARLPGLDNEAIIAAMGSTENAQFRLWPAQDKGA